MTEAEKRLQEEVAELLREAERADEAEDPQYGKGRRAEAEPVFGQVKDARGFRRFSFRGHERVDMEWKLICLTHNLLKLFRAGYCPKCTSSQERRTAGRTRTWPQRRDGRPGNSTGRLEP